MIGIILDYLGNILDPQRKKRGGRDGKKEVVRTVTKRR
jgi:hypothetical protein